MSVLGSEQLVGKQHLYQPSSDAGMYSPVGMKRPRLAGEMTTLQRRGSVLQSTDDPLGVTHSPPFRVELADAHLSTELFSLYE